MNLLRLFSFLLLSVLSWTYVCAQPQAEEPITLAFADVSDDEISDEEIYTVTVPVFKEVPNIAEVVPALNEVLGMEISDSSDEIEIDYSSKDAGVVTISLIDYQHQIHHVDDVMIDSPCMLSHTIAVDDLAPGSYLVKVHFPNGKKTYRQVTR